MEREKHKNLIAWQMADKTHVLVCDILKSSKMIDLKTRSQVLNAASSMVANLVEGDYSQSTGEFIRFAIYSRRSGAELKERILHLRRMNYITEEQYLECEDLIIKTCYLIDRLIVGLKKKKDKDKK